MKPHSDKPTIHKKMMQATNQSLDAIRVHIRSSLLYEESNTPNRNDLPRTKWRRSLNDDDDDDVDADVDDDDADDNYGHAVHDDGNVMFLILLTVLGTINTSP